MRAWTTGESRCSQSWRACGAVLTTLCAVNVIPVAAEEVNTTDRSTVDCRYEMIGMGHSVKAGSSPVKAFPENDVFRPLLADVKQPRFFARWAATEVRNPNSGGEYRVIDQHRLRGIWRKLRFARKTTGL